MTINQLRSKVMKAAWTSIRSDRFRSFSQALKSAWAWAKQTLVNKAQEMVEVMSHVSRETEKAIGVNFTFTCVHTDQSVNRMVWFPKSLMVDGSVPVWFFNKKVQETIETFSQSYQRGLDWSF